MPHKTALPAPSSTGGTTLIRQALYLPLGLATVYLTFFFALLTPIFQRHFIFLHAIQFPFFPYYDTPSKYGLAPFKTRPLTLTTSDGERIGAWHVLPEIFYQTHLANTSNEEKKWSEEVYQRAMREYPTVLYLHGNSMNRAAPFRITAYSALTSRIDANVVAIDYRGFGDSTGTPSEEGLVLDAEAAYIFIRSQQHTSEQGIIVFGQSLGTGITALLAAKLEHHKTPVEGIVLMAPYTDLKSLVKDFKLGGFLPLLAPIGAIPLNNIILNKFLKTQLSTITTLPKVTAPNSSGRTKVVLLHAKDDLVISVSHSRKLFETLLKNAPTTTSVQTREIFNYAQVKKFNPHAKVSNTKDEDEEEKRGTVTLIETQNGGHNQLTEGALDLVRFALHLPSHLSPS